MYQLLSLLIFSIFAQESIPFSPIYPLDTTVSGETINFQWKILEEGYEYKLEILKGPRCISVKKSFPYTEEGSRSVVLSSDGEYCWRLKYRELGTEEFRISDIYLFSYLKDVPEEEEDPVKEDLPDDIVEEEIEDEETEKDPKEEILKSSSIPSPPSKLNENISIEAREILANNQDIQKPTGVNKQGEDKEVLGIEKEEDSSAREDLPLQCSIIYDKRKKKYLKTDCDFEFPNITKVKRYEIDNNFDYVIIEGDLVKTLNLDILILDCERFSLFQPSTWFRCKEKREKRNISVPLLYSPSVKIKKKRSVISTYDIEDGTFLLKIFSEKLNNEEISLTFNIYFYIDIYGDWLDFRDSIEEKLDYSLGTIISDNKDKPLRYVFSKIIGVTQWHGYTAFDSPHTGIDFGAIKEKILSPADGIIYAIGWDSYYGKCNSGGKYLKIKHNNGMYTVYMHLDSYINERGNTWNVGNNIKKGQQVGISGNTGAYNCQPLGYHLHYELRKTSKQNSHTDPVPYTDINWDLIPTLNWQTFSGRLSGDNPHPNF